MLRAVLVSAGTAVGLVAVFSYSGGDEVPALATGPADVVGLGAPTEPPVTSTSPSPRATTAAPRPSADPSTARPSASTTAPAASATPSAGRSTSPAPGRRSATAAPRPAPSWSATTPAPRPTTSSPRPTPTPTATTPPSTDYLGSLVTHRHGQVQVGIRVQDGRIVRAWAAVYPTGEAQPYTSLSIPKLVRETLEAQSADVATVSGATLTSDAWRESLQVALAQAGL